jgi:hypothetical protein
MKKKILVLVLIATVAVSVPSRAQLVVFDPINFITALEHLAELVDQYTQMIQTYEQIRAQYDHWVWMAKRLSGSSLSQYRALANSWRSLSAGDTYHTLDGWISAANTGADALDGYRRATQSLQAYGAAAGRMPADAWDRAKTRFDQVELLDASSARGLETIGQIRARADDTLRATRALEDDSLSTADDVNTLVAVLNKINAAGVLSIRTNQNANQLLVSLLETQLADAARRRDAEVTAINGSVLFQQDGRRFANQFTGGTTAAIVGFRLP